MIYLVPDTGDTKELVTVTSRTGIPLHNPKNAREFILATQGDAIAVASVSEDLLLVLSRHASSFFPDELPLALLSVPGMLYQPGWASMATVFPPAHFREFVDATKRSGVLATDGPTVEARDRGALLIDRRTPSAMSGDELPADAEDLDHDTAEY